MRPEKPKRVETNPVQHGLAGLGDALAGLDTARLPAGPSQPQPAQPPAARKHGRVVLRRETAHRGGRTVVVLYDFPQTTTPGDLESLAKKLRGALGTGGTVKERTIEIQGDQPAKVREALERIGWQVAGA